MAEGHAWIDDAAELVYTFHTIRWINQTQQTPFAAVGRNRVRIRVRVLVQRVRVRMHAHDRYPSFGQYKL